VTPEYSLAAKQSLDTSFPNRAGFPDPKPSGWVGLNSGFASGQNQLTWQQATYLAGSPSEEFADMFLGAVYDTWENSDAGRVRSGWMRDYMPAWIAEAGR
jgi:hypothetical protein